MNIRAIVTGATGMVGEGVLHECLQDSRVKQVLSVSRKPSGLTHPKLQELIVPDFYDLSAVASQLKGYNACFFCLGVSSVNLKEPDYYRLTHTLTMNMATLLSRQNPDMTFCYVSGMGTDSTEQGITMWARVKGKTENNLMALPFKQVFNFRPGYIHPTPDMKHTKSYYKYINWLYPILSRIVPSYVVTLQQLSRAMINTVGQGKQRRILEVNDIKALGRGEGVRSEGRRVRSEE
ncbi:NAD-dependent epimerase/dehydratase family protein [Fibrella aquatica]|uniref:NAD-dependent epimerase/dehydratase family protein n=1 Tax=Fibrella aquatica TaxID=3242487 RepID=UPI0035230AEC